MRLRMELRTLLYLGIVLLLIIAGCAKVPTDYPRTVSQAFRDTADTGLGRALGPLIEAHPGSSGIHPLTRGQDAFLARIVLTEMADRSLDVQYYIWHDDTTGRLLLERILLAADSGVRVRLLLDDLGTAAADRMLLAIDAHRNIEVRLFNPVALRSARGIGAAADFDRVNRRMHNKSLTADNQAAIIGGRNVGDEYFEARPDLDFGDMDVVVIGPVVEEVSSAFDLFWNSDAAIPMTAFGGRVPPQEEITNARETLRKENESNAAASYLTLLRQSAMADQLRRNALPFFWGGATLVYDEPAKARPDAANDAKRLMTGLGPVLDAIARQLLVVSPYFVPGKEGVAFFRSLRRRGVQVSIMTNSLASNDVSAVHAGYAKYRKRLLEEGIGLYEIIPTADIQGRRKAKKKQTGGVGGSSRASLHAKVFVVDRRTVFVGSMNIDPRSIDINTEIGVVFDSAEFGSLTADNIEETIRRDCYRLALDADGDIVWTGREGGREVRYTSEPRAGLWRRFSTWFLSLLPIEGQL